LATVNFCSAGLINTIGGQPYANSQRVKLAGAGIDSGERKYKVAFNAYLTLKGQRQGEIHGPVTLPGRENTIAVLSFAHQIVSPRDPASGLPIGKRQHQQLQILKEVDKTSPLVWNVLVSNEDLIDWALQFWEIPAEAGGAEKPVYTIRLTNASIASIRESMNDTQNLVAGGFPLPEAISFTYQKIEWIWADGEITAEDSWQN
jgi:type VI secretion system secreted protein Hcp